jgi:hypothetical protein
MKFCLLNLYFLGTWILLSLLRIQALAPVSLGLWCGLAYLIAKPLVQRKNWTMRGLFNEIGFEARIGLTLVLAYGILVRLWFKDLWALPSNDDTIAHLTYLGAILEQKTCLIGHTLKSGSEFFSEANFNFYPTGAHGLIALWGFPLWSLGMKLPSLISLAMQVALCAWPLALWSGILKIRPDLPVATRLFLVVSALTLPIFPLWPLGEGGLSRIIALVICCPLWFSAIRSGASGLLWGAVLAPVLLFIHPSVLPFLGLAVLFFPKREIRKACLAAPAGIIVFALILKSGSQAVFDLKFAPEFAGWFDRLKGPFHYWFSDPYGVGKFLSPKNWPLYLSIGLIVARKADPRALFLLATPFLLAASTFVPIPFVDKLGLVYYHSIKRMAELMPLLGLTIAGIALRRELLPKPGFHRMLVACSVGLFIWFGYRSIGGLEAYHGLYHSPMKDKAALASKNLINGAATNPQNRTPRVVILNDDHAYDSLKFESGMEVYNLWTECQPHEAETPYCKNRRAFIHMAGTVSGKGNSGMTLWWIPRPGEQPGSSLSEIALDEGGKAYRIQ